MKNKMIPLALALFSIEMASSQGSSFAAADEYAKPPMDYYIDASTSGAYGTVYVNGFKIMDGSRPVDSTSQFISPYLKKGENKVVVAYAETSELDPNAKMSVEVLSAIPLKDIGKDDRKVIANWKVEAHPFDWLQMMVKPDRVLIPGNQARERVRGFSFVPCGDSLQLGLRYADKPQRLPAGFDVDNGNKKLSKVQVHFLSSTGLERVVYDGITIDPGSSRILLDDAKITSGKPLVNAGLFDSILVVVPKDKVNPDAIQWAKVEVKGSPRWETKEITIDVPNVARYSWQDAQPVGELDAGKIEMLRKEVAKLRQSLAEGKSDISLGCLEKVRADYAIMTGKPASDMEAAQKKQFEKFKSLGLREISLECLRFIKINDRVVVAETCDGHPPVESNKKKSGGHMAIPLHYCLFNGQWKLVY